MARLIPVLLLCMGFTGCTIRVIDDTADYDFQGSMKADGCEVELKRIEEKTTGRREASAKQ